MINVLPEYQVEDLSRIKKTMSDGFKNSNEYDVFIDVTNSGGAPIILNWLIAHFNGHVVVFSGESDEEDPVLGTDKSKVHGCGSVRHPPTH
jgi:hypothetical protein